MNLLLSLLASCGGIADSVTKLSAAPIPKSLKWLWFRSFLNLTLFRLSRRYPEGELVYIPFVGKRLMTYSLRMLTVLFDEIFVNLEYWFQAENPHPYILDCGSNVGVSIIFFKMLYPQAKIIGFEPSPRTFELLTQNIAAYGLTDVEVYQLAVGRTEGEVEFFISSENPISGIATTQKTWKPEKHTECIRVKQSPVSKFIDRQIDLLKLDVEGAENAVLEDLITSSKLKCIRHLILEYHHHLDQSPPETLWVFLQQLERSGFQYYLAAQALPKKRKNKAKFQNIRIYAYNQSPLSAQEVPVARDLEY